MSIFTKCQLRPTQLRTVAGRRLGDAKALWQTGKNERANGAMYLGGFAVECLLKAKLLERFPWLQNAGSPEGRSKKDGRLWALCYRLHDLEEILENLTVITDKLKALEHRESNRLSQSLKAVCGWTVYARYSPQSADLREAAEFLDQIEELKPWLT